MGKGEKEWGLGSTLPYAKSILDLDAVAVSAEGIG
jgi:hypothetical protein